MKTIIQLLIVALVVNAAYQGARSYYAFFDYRSSLTEEVQKPRITSTSQLRARALELASDYGINLEPDAITIRVEGDRTYVDFSYVDAVPFVPKYYVRPMEYEGSVNAHRYKPLQIDDRNR
jgi:hypothetical protein